jgi:predicted RecA/RadA family phage recombinase
MKKRALCVALFAAVLMLVGGCGGGGGGSSDGGSGTLSMSVTDAKPVIPGEPTELWITFEEVRAHTSGGGWVTLPLPRTPLSINLLAFSDGNTTDLVPPVQLDSGKYTQLRFEVSRAYMVINGGTAVEIDLDVPSGFLRIDKNFTFDVPSGEAVDLTVDFDLSQSIVVTGSSEYKLQPVLHLVETQQGATIHGKIDQATFGSSTEAVVTVIWDQDASRTETPGDEEYTRVTVAKASGANPTEFSIFWLVPGEDYIVEIDFNGADPPERTFQVEARDLSQGSTYELNTGNAI